MKKILSPAFGLVLLSLLALPGQAQMINVANNSFESPVISSVPNFGGYFFAPGADAGNPSTAVPDWAFVDSEGVGGLMNVTINGGMTGADGSQFAFFNNVPGGGISTLTYDGAGPDALPSIASLTSYTLTVALGNNTTGASSSPGTFYLNLLAGGTPVATSGEIFQSSIPVGTFEDFSVNLTSAEASSFVGQQLGIQLVAGAYTGSNFTEEQFDNIRLSQTQTVPEPSIWVMTLGGIAFLGVLIRRKRAHFQV